jgi:hypothetical protein
MVRVAADEDGRNWWDFEAAGFAGGLDWWIL